MEIGSGAWSWFADPRAVVSGGLVYVGFIDGAGDVRVAALDRAAALVTTATLRRGLGVDDHHNPALLLRADGRLQAFYSGHTGPDLFFGVGESIAQWGPEQRVGTNTPGSRGYTYPNPVQLEAENGRIHLFWRGGDFNPAFSTSADGLAWAPAETLVRMAGQRPYVKVASDGVATINVAFTDGHPRETATSLFYAATSPDRGFEPEAGASAHRRSRPATPTSSGTSRPRVIALGSTTSPSTRPDCRGSSTPSSLPRPTTATATRGGRAPHGRTAS